MTPEVSYSAGVGALNPLPKDDKIGSCSSQSPMKCNHLYRCLPKQGNASQRNVAWWGMRSLVHGSLYYQIDCILLCQRYPPYALLSRKTQQPLIKNAEKVRGCAFVWFKLTSSLLRQPVVRFSQGEIMAGCNMFSLNLATVGESTWKTEYWLN